MDVGKVGSSMVRGFRAVRQRQGWGASADGHQNSLVSLIGANASPSFADAVTLLPEANLANSVNLLQLPPVEMWPWICIHSCHFFQDLPPREELPAWQDTQGWTRQLCLSGLFFALIEI